MELVYMSLIQFDAFRSQNRNLEYLCMKEFKFDLNSEFKTIVGMTLEHFKEEVILKQFSPCQ